MKYSLYSAFIIYIVLVKLAFIFLSITKIIVKHRNPKNTKMIEKLEFWRERTEFIFITCMAILLICIFYPGSKIQIDRETQILLYLFGIILLITAKWSTFFKESPTIKEIQHILSNR